MAVDYTSWESDPASNGSGSPPYRYPSGSLRGSDVDDSLRVITAGIRSLGDIAAKLPSSGGVVDEGPNDGKIGTAAFLNVEELDPTSGDFYNRTRVVAGRDLRLFWGTLAEAATEATYGWAICDGRTQNGVVTPDLRGRFPMFYSASDAPKATGGATSKTTSSNGSHSHGGATGNFDLTSTYLPSLSVSAPTSNVESGGDTARVTGVSVSYSGTGGGHSHSISSDGGHTHTISDIRPAWAAIVPLLWVGVP